MKYLILVYTLMILSFMACENSSESDESEKLKDTMISNDTSTEITSLKIEDPFKDSLQSYFDDPVNFYTLKKETEHMHSGGSFNLDNDFFHKDEDEAYLYYEYWAIEFDTENFYKSLNFKVLKPRGEKSNFLYSSNDEILIGIKSKIAWLGLDASDFVGKTKTQITDKFGEPDFQVNNCLCYYIRDKILILNIPKDKVEWFKYFWLRDNIRDEEDLPEELFFWNK